MRGKKFSFPDSTENITEKSPDLKKKKNLHDYLSLQAAGADNGWPI